MPSNLIIGIVVYLIICAGAGIYVAVAKWREPFEGIVFGALFGPLGVLIVACLPQGAEPEPAGSPVQVDTPEQVAAVEHAAGLAGAAACGYESWGSVCPRPAAYGVYPAGATEPIARHCREHAERAQKAAARDVFEWRGEIRPLPLPVEA